MTSHSQSPDAADRLSHRVSYPHFLWRSLTLATDGSLLFYAWMTLLTAVFLVGVNAWSHQVAEGMILTHMTDHVSWGLYIANFTFLVGLAAGGVMMVIPAYLYHNDEMHELSIAGELLAIAAIVMCLFFVTVDLGRPDRFWHLIPGVGRFHFPVSMLTWDVLVLSGYLLINLHICGYILYTRFRGERPHPGWYVPVVFLSIVWAISIHTVTAFLYCGLGGRPFWNSALMAPRFLASAFVSGPAFLLVALTIVKSLTRYQVGSGAVRTLVNIIRVSILVNLLMLVSELFTQFYSGGAHGETARYMYFGIGEATGLVRWSWAALILNVVGAGLFLNPRITSRTGLLVLACLTVSIGIWIEKGMGLIIPGFVPSTLHELVEYAPSTLEWKIMAGGWALGLIVFTVAMKIAISVLTGETREHIQARAAAADAG